jgi:hypothetical protein
VTVSGIVGTRSEAEMVKRWIGTIEGVVDVEPRALHYRIDDRHISPPTGLSRRVRETSAKPPSASFGPP